MTLDGAVPLVTAVASTLIAILSGWFAWRQKVALEKLKSAVAFDDQETKALLEYLKLSNQLIQEFRDALRIIATAQGNLLSMGAAAQMIQAIADRFMRAYQEHVGMLDRETASIAHDTKNVMHTCARWLADRPGATFASELNARDRRHIAAARRALAKLQRRLGDARVELVQQKVSAGV